MATYSSIVFCFFVLFFFLRETISGVYSQLETQSSFYPAFPLGNKTQPQHYQLISSMEFLFIDIPANKVGRNDKLLTFTTSNERTNLGLNSQIVLSFDKITYTVTSLVVHLKLHASNEGGESLIPGQ